MDRIAEIEKEMNAIYERNSHWKSSQDGSFEMALDMSGYYKLMKERDDLMKENHE